MDERTSLPISRLLGKALNILSSLPPARYVEFEEALDAAAARMGIILAPPKGSVEVIGQSGLVLHGDPSEEAANLVDLLQTGDLLEIVSALQAEPWSMPEAAARQVALSATTNRR